MWSAQICFYYWIIANIIFNNIKKSNFASRAASTCHAGRMRPAGRQLDNPGLTIPLEFIVQHEVGVVQTPTPL